MKQSKLMKQALVLTLALGMVGCSFWGAPSGISPSTSPKLATAVRISGTLRITIKWPNSNYNTNLLPDSTNRVVIKVKQGATTIATKEVSRAAEPSISTSLDVDAGSGYTLEVDGLRDSTPVAHGAASGVNVKSGRVTTVPTIVMAALSVPAINAVVNSDGQPVAQIGDTVTLQGTNLGNDANLSLQIALNGAAIPAGNITRDVDGIHVVIPAGSTCGTMSLKVDNVPAVTNNPLWIVNSVSVPATASVLNHSTLLLSPTIGWVLAGGDTAAKFGTPPDPLYTINPSNQGTVTGNVFSPNATSAGPVNLTPKMGSLVGSSIAVTIRPKVNGVSMNTPTATINATSVGSGALGGYVSTVNLGVTINGDAFNNGVTWTSGDVGLATVDANGVVTANNAGTAGTVIITATSKDDPSKTAQATITVTDFGSAAFEVN